jgi:hypothetical protein
MFFTVGHLARKFVDLVNETEGVKFTCEAFTSGSIYAFQDYR